MTKPLTSSESLPSSSSRCMPVVAGELLCEDDRDGSVVSQRRVYVGREITIGRDQSRCQWVFDDPYMSAKHIRIYTVVYENEIDTEVDPLVYAEDLSRYGVFWNGALMGKGNGGYLLSHKDRLRLSAQTTLRFVAPKHKNLSCFDIVQEMEMSAFGDEYVLTDRLLGAGAYGRVFMAHNYITREQLACKVIDLRKLKHENASQQFIEKPASAKDVDPAIQLRKIKSWASRHRNYDAYSYKIQRYLREVEILSSLIHPNIVSIDKVFATDNTIYIFQDLITAGDLFSYLEMKNYKILESEVAAIVRQIAIALQFLHNNRIVHRDLKPDNVMVTSMCAGARIALTDFGAACRIGHVRQRMESIVGTKEYAAPEVIGINTFMKQQSKVGYTTAVDLWSLGTIAVLLLTGTVAFADPISGSYSPRLAGSCNLEFLQNSPEWKQLRARPRDFITNLLVLDENKRLTATSALEHTWFSNVSHKVDFEELYQRTIRDWCPRRAKNPVIKFQDGSKIKNLALSRSVVSTDKGFRVTHKPVEPPHKPFPRRMYLELWQARKTERTMPDEVKDAILEHWSHKAFREASKSTSSFMDTSKICETRSVIHMGNEEQQSAATWNSVEEQAYQVTPNAALIRQGNSANSQPSTPAQTSVSPQESSIPYRPLRSKIVADTGVNLTYGKEERALVHPHRKQSTGNAETVVQRSTIRSHSLPVAIPVHSVVKSEPTCTLPTVSGSSKESKPRERKRKSIFDLFEEYDQGFRDENNLAATKRPRPIVRWGSTDREGEINDNIKPHHKSAMVKAEWDLVEK